MTVIMSFLLMTTDWLLESTISAPKVQDAIQSEWPERGDSSVCQAAEQEEGTCDCRNTREGDQS